MSVNQEAAAATHQPGGFFTLARYRLLLLRNLLDEQIKTAPWRVLTIMALLGFIWVALYLLLEQIFIQVQRWELIAVVANQLIFIYFFLVLSIMLAFSNAILSFGSLFGKSEAGHLLAMPVRPRDVVMLKWIEGMLLSSWSFMLLGVPLMFAIARVVPVQWYFYPLFVAHFIGFVALPATLGMLAAWIVAMWAPRRPAPTAIWVGVVILLIAIIWFASIYQTTERGSEEWLQVVLEHLSIAKQQLVPSTWTAKGVIAAIEQRVDESLFYLMIVVGHTIFPAWLIINIVAANWSEAYSRARRGRYRPTIRHGWFTLGLSWLLFFYMPRTSRLILLKDLRSFARDATQWSQMVIMLGLLVIYVLNLPRMPVDLDRPGMKALIAFLNLTTVSMILATFTSRFVYPLLSLESQQLWLLGLLPAGRGAIVRVKFAFALTLTVLSALCVMLLSGAVLGLPAEWLIMNTMITFAICCGLCGLSVGLGARFPVLGQRNPARIAAGFGGTFNLIASMLFVLTEMAGVGYLSMTEVRSMTTMTDSLSDQSWLIVGGLLAIAAVTALVPMIVGARHLERLEH